MNARRISRPIGVRTGIFCKFGSLEEMRPVAAMVWSNQVWMRPSRPVSRSSAVDIGALELGDLPIEQNLVHGRVQLRQLAKGVRVGGIAARGLLFGGQAERIEENAAQLLRAVQVERRTRRRARRSRPSARRSARRIARPAGSARRDRRGSRRAPCRKAWRAAAARYRGRAGSSPARRARAHRQASAA